MEPKIRFDPIFRMIATAMTARKRKGSSQEVVVRIRISRMMTTDTAMAMAISPGDAALPPLAGHRAAGKATPIPADNVVNFI